jgi:hypothetical protein
VTLLACLLVTAVVWAVSLMPSVRLRAFVYSLPLPITLVLAATDIHADGTQLIGVALLVAFVGLVSVLHKRFDWPILLADIGGLAGYVGISAAFGLLPTLPTGLALTAVSVAWVIAVALLKPWHTMHMPIQQTQRLPAIAKLAIVFAAALLTIQVAALLRGLVVTFPYSGVLVVIETRHHLSNFSKQFTMNSLGLIAFLTSFILIQDHNRTVALATAWIAFAATTALLTLTSNQLKPRDHPKQNPSRK